MHCAIGQIHIYQILIRYAGFLSLLLKVINGSRIDFNGNLFFSGLHMGFVCPLKNRILLS